MNLQICTFVLFLGILSFSFAQNTASMSVNQGFENRDLQGLIGFENLFFEKLIFEGKAIKGKSYSIEIIEYINGKESSRKILFDGKESDYFNIRSEKETLNFFAKLDEGKLKVQMHANGFRSKKMYYDLEGNADIYALKDFLASNETITIDLQKKHPVFAIVTPTVHKDGSNSYCEVAQSNIATDQLGKHFKIPHYFIVNIQFV
ncbi:hypothetical protein [Aquimarina litoralis]|uniref:hypothetical protein n=1 Tax=Aquimarina litoralis TaxID=584605 RepID=UPI001C564327|nr:hypothetical protein [Aquimarina litoralis]MBW1294368.1 hypothetical protein [Aquimarina litoralis]